MRTSHRDCVNIAMKSWQLQVLIQTSRRIVHLDERQRFDSSRVCVWSFRYDNPCAVVFVHYHAWFSDNPFVKTSIQNVSAPVTFYSLRSWLDIGIGKWYQRKPQNISITDMNQVIRLLTSRMEWHDYGRWDSIASALMLGLPIWATGLKVAQSTTANITTLHKQGRGSKGHLRESICIHIHMHIYIIHSTDTTRLKSEKSNFDTRTQHLNVCGHSMRIPQQEVIWQPVEAVAMATQACHPAI